MGISCMPVKGFMDRLSFHSHIVKAGPPDTPVVQMRKLRLNYGVRVESYAQGHGTSELQSLDLVRRATKPVRHIISCRIGRVTLTFQMRKVRLREGLSLTLPGSSGRQSWEALPGHADSSGPCRAGDTDDSVVGGLGPDDSATRWAL